MANELGGPFSPIVRDRSNAWIDSKDPAPHANDLRPTTYIGVTPSVEWQEFVDNGTRAASRGEAGHQIARLIRHTGRSAWPVKRSTRLCRLCLAAASGRPPLTAPTKYLRPRSAPTHPRQAGCGSHSSPGCYLRWVN
jgi:hypothetical protein